MSAVTAMTPERALDEMIRQVAWASTGTQRRLSSCQLCRNHLLYLLDTIPLSGDEDHARRVIAARLGALPDVHRGHRAPGHPDNASPQIRWVLT
jgi:hypothetical protein